MKNIYNIIGWFPYVHWSGNRLLLKVKTPSNRFKHFCYRYKLVYVDKGTRNYLNDTILNPRILGIAYYLHTQDIQKELMKHLNSRI